MRDRPLARGCREPCSGRQVRQQSSDGFGETCRIARVHRDGAIRRPVGDIADAGANHRNAARRGFERDHARRFVARRQNDEMRAAVEIDHRVDGPDTVKRHPRVDAQLVNESLDGSVERAYPYEP